MKCVMCNHERLEDGTIEETIQTEETTYVFTNVPAKVCPNCNENYLSTSTMRQLSCLIKVNTKVKK